MQPHSNARASWPSSDDTTGFYLLVIVAGLAALSYALWTNYHATISADVMAVHHAEIGLLHHFTDRYVADQQMQARNPADMTLHDLYAISHDVGGFVRIPAVSVILVLAAVCFLRAAPSRFRRAFDLDGLIAEQARPFPTSAAFVRRRLPARARRPWRARPGDYALTPAEWLASHATRRDGSFDESAARAALTEAPIEPILERAFGVVRRAAAQSARPVRAYSWARGTWNPMLVSVRSPWRTSLVCSGHAPSDERRSSSAAIRVLCSTRISCTLGMLV